MLIADDVIEGRFLRRDNRFRVSVEIKGKLVAAHLPNSGRLGELLLPGAPVALVPRSEEGRRTAFDMVQIFAQGRWIGTDSRMPNKLIAEALDKNKLPDLGEYSSWRAEPRIDEGRLDFALEAPSCSAYIEVKGVTLVKEQVALFPDAPTKRGTRHILSLLRLVAEGSDAFVIFVVQRDDANRVKPNTAHDPDFGAACLSAKRAGVKFLAFRCISNFGRIELADAIPVMIV